LTGASSNSAIERGAYFLTPLTYETPPGRLLTSNKMKISNFIQARPFPLERLREKNAESFRSQQWNESRRGWNL